MLAFSNHAADQPSSDEAALADYADRLAQHREGRRAVHIRLSGLAAINRRDHHIRIAMNTFEPLLKKFEGQLFRMWNKDLVVAVKDASISDIDDYAIKLQFLFAEDPLLSEQSDEATAFCVWFDMERDYPKFRTLADTFQHELDEHRAALEEKPAGAAALATSAQETPPEEPLTPQLLDRFENALATTDISSMVRQQMICAFPAAQHPQPVMCEHFVSTQELQKKLLPGVNCLSDRWLFQHLCQTLDYRMLIALPEIARTVDLPISMNINVSTLLSAEFLKFDTLLRKHSQKTVILEVQSADLFGDMSTYLFAREFVKDRGYGLALDGLTQITFPLIDRKKLKLDFEKIFWSPEMADDGREGRRKEFASAIGRAGPDRVILCRCDDQTAIDFGQSIGIRLFQGRYVDSLLAKG